MKILKPKKFTIPLEQEMFLVIMKNWSDEQRSFVIEPDYKDHDCLRRTAVISN